MRFPVLFLAIVTLVLAVLTADPERSLLANFAFMALGVFAAVGAGAVLGHVRLLWIRRQIRRLR